MIFKMSTSGFLILAFVMAVVVPTTLGRTPNTANRPRLDLKKKVFTPHKHGSLNGRKVVLMSMDGFRYDYLTKTDTPNFDALIASGVKVPYVNNTFATLTFPCHYSIATGRYEESHGIVANKMYDPVFKATFKMGNVEPRWWDGAEPIWLNAVKAGLQVGTYFWPGSEVKLQGHRPTQWRAQPYNGKVPFHDRVDSLISDWLVAQNVDFGVIYFNEPDHTGHTFGPDSPEVVQKIQEMDQLLGYFIKKLQEAKLEDSVDFILTSDHGMTSLDMDHREIVLADHVNNTLLKTVVGGGALAHLIPQDGKTAELVEALSGVANMTVYLKEDIPDSFHYKHHRRVMPVVAIANEGWDIRAKKPTWRMKGNHGYSNDYMNMKPILIASGPSFKKGVEVDPIKNVDIYPLLCHLLKIDPAPNNGSFARVESFLNGHKDKGNNSPSIYSSPFTSVFMTVLFTYFVLSDFKQRVL